MSHVHHELHEEFPEDGEVLHALKLGDAHFQKLSDKYHDVNREIHRIEANVEAASDFRLEDLKKERLHLLDEISHIVSRSRVS